MIKSNNDPNYIFEEYKGYIIASHKNNVAERHVDNFILVYKKEEFPDYGFCIGLDDSKSSGGRIMVPNNLEDAKAYIDWLAEQRLKSDVKKTKITKQRKGPKL